MATVKVKFRPSSIPNKEGRLYYQIIHERSVRQMVTDYRNFPNEWDEARSSVISGVCPRHVHAQLHAPGNELHRYGVSEKVRPEERLCDLPQTQDPSAAEH